jgi:uncharacterized protein
MNSMKNIYLFSFLIFLSPFLKAQTEMELQTMTGTIYGTLEYTATQNPVPVVLLISGSGPTDRDGNNTKMKNNSLKMLADSLLSHGIASLRYDKRGIAASIDAGPDESELRFDNYVADAIAWIGSLKKDKRFSKVIVAGHSEGSLIGMIAASKANANGFISIAGAGRSADLILKEQLAGQPESIKNGCYSTIDSLVAGKTVDNINPLLFNLFRRSIQPYLISWFKYDPQQEIHRLTIPILILQGTTDLQVSVEDARLLGEAAPGSKVRLITGMNHILKNASQLRQENIATYDNPTLPLNEIFVKEILSFLQSFQ